MKLKHERLNNAINNVRRSLSDFFSLLKSWLITGIFMIAPAALTLYIIYFIFQFSDGILGNIFAEYIGHQVPGIGLIIPILACLLLGAVAQNYGKRITKALDGVMMNIPIIKSVYTGIKQVAEVIMRQNKSEFKRVVLLEYPKDDCWVLGFVTADFNYSINDPRLAKNLVSVFMPTTPNPTSGYLLILSKDKIVDVDIDIEVAMKIIISGGLVQATSSEDENTSNAAIKAIDTVNKIQNEQEKNKGETVL